MQNIEPFNTYYVSHFKAYLFIISGLMREKSDLVVVTLTSKVINVV